VRTSSGAVPRVQPPLPACNAHGGTNPDADAQVNYRQSDDAVEVAHTLGAQPTDQTTDDGERVRDYLFPDGSTTRIIVQADNIGSGII
jgi:hypothetical protein